MFVKVLLTCLVFLAVSVEDGVVSGLPSHLHGKQRLSQNITDLILEFDYPVQNYTVETVDGYQLDLIRIPGCPAYKPEFQQLQKRQQGPVQTGKPVVVLMHGLLSSAEDFVIGGPSEGLAFYLAKSGFDVFLANARGSIYGRKHKTLNPEKDAAFWRFCWNEIGVKDLPAIIDEVLEITGQEQVNYVGHMQGTTAFYVLASERPEYNSKVAKMVSLGPIAFMKGAINPLLQKIAENQQSKPWQMKNLGVNEFHPSNEFLTAAGQEDCMALEVNERVCQNPYFLINGYESTNWNMTTIKKYVPLLPAGASTKQVLHYSQLIKSGRFEKYSEEAEATPEEYELSSISVPVSLIYAPNDKLSSEQDVKVLAKKLGNVKNDIKLAELNNNLDLLYCNNVQSVVYGTVLDILKGR